MGARRVVLLADLDYFYSQAEELRNPSMRGKPVVVCVYSGRTEESGVVATANYEARKYGVRSGMPIALAKKRLSGADPVFLPVDFPYYKEVSERVIGIMKEYSDQLEQVGLDEAYLDVSNRVEDFAEAEQLAKEIKRRVLQEAGLKLTIGVGPNKIIAKMASDAAKPDGLMVIRPENVEEFISPLPVDKIPGVGKKTAERLERMGIKTIKDLAQFDPVRLVDEFGESLGAHLHAASRGEDEDPVRGRAEAGSMSRIITLKENTKDLKAVLPKVDEICEEIHERAVREGVLFRTIGIIAITSDLGIKTRTKSLPAPTDDLGTLKRESSELVKKFLQSTDKEIRRIGVHISDFTRREKGQRTLSGYI
ncbi:MAG: DNA polymerase IV [Candidatus Methanosuratincola verstraetei]|uniref:DNA polymerase IV n=1 Tax=Methanosuratincola subterraneus TaxID=2593994 RepID=A0A444L933_METS7|nr:MAG: DNA polymerase IV [Candidatus Methanosuratincola subterraneus]